MDPKLNELTLNYGMGMSISCHQGQCEQRIDEQTTILEIKKISKNYYEYVKHFYMYEKARYGEILEGVISPHELYSNVENGMGIFAAYSAAVDSVKTRLGRDATWSLSIYNLYNRRNPYFYFYNTERSMNYSVYYLDDPKALKQYQFTFFPIIPSVSYKVQF